MGKKRLKHYGMCDASAGIALGNDKFAAANDEDNYIKIFDAHQSGKYTGIIDAGEYFRTAAGQSEADIEGVSEIDGVIYWITSHGRDSEGNIEAPRFHFFANTISLENGAFTHAQVGTSYINLLADLKADPRYKKYKLHKAERIPPKEKGGLNIEGLSATPDKRLLIGFRNPIRKGKALIVPVNNPAAVLRGEKMIFGDPIEIKLKSRGIRSIEYWPSRKEYIIVAGAYYSGGKFGIYRWSGKPGKKPKRLKGLKIKSLNPEGIVIYPDINDKFQILSDDGNIVRKNGLCKKLCDDDPGKYFRSLWVKVS